MKFGTWGKRYAWIGLLQASYPFPSGTSYFSAVGEPGGKVAKTWPFLGQYRQFQCSMICVVIVVCTGWVWAEWEKVFERGSPEPRAESQSTTANVSKWRMAGGRRKRVRSRELQVTWGTWWGVGQGPDHGMLRTSDFILSMMEATTYYTERLHHSIHLLEIAEVWVGWRQIQSPVLQLGSCWMN